MAETVNDLINKVQFSDPDGYEQLNKLSPMAKLTFANIVQKISENGGNSLSSGSYIGVKFINGNPLIYYADGQVGKGELNGIAGDATKQLYDSYTSKDTSKLSTQNITEGSVIDTTKNLGENFINNSLGLDKDGLHKTLSKTLVTNGKRGGQEHGYPAVNLGSASGVLAQGELSAVLINKDNGYAGKIVGNIELGKLEAKLEVKTTKIDASLEATLGEAGLKVSGFNKPDVKVLDNGDIEVKQWEAGGGVSWSLSLTKPPMSISIVLEHNDISENQFAIFGSFNEYEKYINNAYQPKLEEIERLIKHTKGKELERLITLRSNIQETLYSCTNKTSTYSNFANSTYHTNNSKTNNPKKSPPLVVPDTIIPKSQQLETRSHSIKAFIGIA